MCCCGVSSQCVVATCCLMCFDLKGILFNKDWVSLVEKNFHLLTIKHTLKVRQHPAAWGGEGYATNVYTGSLHPEVQPFTLLYIIFHEKGVSFAYLLLTNGTSFTNLVKNFAFLSTAVNHRSITKIERSPTFKSH